MNETRIPGPRSAEDPSAETESRAITIDMYTWGDPWDPATFSHIPQEVWDEFDRLNVAGNAYDMLPLSNSVVRHIPYYHLLAQLPYVRFEDGELHYTRYFDPRFRSSIERSVGQLYRDNPTPDAVVMMPWGYPNFGDTPYFVYKDMTLRDALSYRSDVNFDWFDGYPDSVLRNRVSAEENVYRDAAGAFVASDWMANTMIESYGVDPDRVHTIGIAHRYAIRDVGEETVNARFDDPEILFVGLDGSRKGLDLLVDAYEQLDDGTKLTVVTDVDDLSGSIADFCRAEPQVELHDTLPADRLTELYGRASVFVMPSRFEPWGKVFSEAMSFGLPVIGADRCAMPEFIDDGHNGYVTPLDPSVIADRIERVHTDRDAYAAMSRNATDVAEWYTAESVVGRMVDAIRGTVHA